MTEQFRAATAGGSLAIMAGLIFAISCSGSGDDEMGDSARHVVEESSRAHAVVADLRAKFSTLREGEDEVVWLQGSDGIVPEFDRQAAREVDTRLPNVLTQPFVLRHVASSVSIEVRLDGASNVPPEVAGGLVVYPGALEGHDVIYRAGLGGLEDFVAFDVRPAEEHLRYVVELGDGVAGVRSLENVIEFLDGAGVPRLRVAPPYVMDAKGVTHWATLDVTGCTVDKSPAPPWEREPLNPQSASCDVTVSWAGQDLAYPVVVDPSWTPTGNMATSRYWHTAALLPAGTVLVAGGSGPGGTILSSAEIYNPATGTWTVTDSMDDSRYAHAGGAIVSGSANYVLAVGGSGSCGVPCNKAERYAVSTSTWQPTGNLNVPRVSHTYTTMPLAAERGLITGGITTGGVAVNTAETYDPSTNSWSSTPGAMTVNRSGHTATAILSGASTVVVVVGGSTGSGITGAVEQFTPGTGVFTSLATSLPVYAHTATAVSTDDLLVAGGVFNSTSCTRSARRLDLGGNSWSAAGSLPVARCYHTATKLVNGNVLVAGGQTAPGSAPTNRAEIYNVATNTWTSQPTLATSRYLHTAVLYPAAPSNKVLLAGGTQGGANPLAAAEFYTP